MSSQQTDLLAVGRRTLNDLRDALAAGEVEVDPKLEVRPGEALLCYYSLQDGQIYLSAPDREQARGKFEFLFYRSLLDLASDDEVVRFLELLIPWLIAHEVGHHLRHRYGCFGSDLELEEQIANQLASAFVKPRLTPAQKLEFQGTLARVLACLSSSVSVQGETGQREPARGLIRHIHTHASAVYHDLMTPASLTISEFARHYLK
jgi:hypothetical protein